MVIVLPGIVHVVHFARAASRTLCEANDVLVV